MKKTTPSLKVLSVVLCLSLFTTTATAQFEQKLTLQGAMGYVQSLNPDWFKDVFQFGASLDAGVQYNFNRTTSLVGLFKYSVFASNDEVFIEDAFYNLVGLSICPKYRFFPRSIINPYVYGGLTLNYSSFSYYEYGELVNTPWDTQVGFTGGIGLDLRITDNLALFWQTGVTGINYPDWFLTKRHSQIGINISMFKARAL